MEQRSIGERLRALRRAKGFTQAKLAEQMQVSTRSIIYWESERYTPGEYGLQALLDTLEVPHAEQAQMLQSLPVPRGEKLLLQGQALQVVRPETKFPGAGDLLGALRVRQGLSRVQAAHTLGVAATTWGRWENSRVAIPHSLLPRIQTLLNASAAEVEALQRRMALPLDDTPFSVEQAWERVIAFDRGRYVPGVKTVDLDALALQGKLWLLQLTHGEARISLAQVSLDYAAWLHSQNRFADAKYQAQQALSLFAQDKNPLLSIAGPLNILSMGETSVAENKSTGASSRAKIGLRLLSQWLPRIGRPSARAMLLSDAALLTARLDPADDTAQRYFADAQRALAEVEGDTDDVSWYLKLTHTRILLAQKRPLEAIEALPSPLLAPEQTDPGIGHFHFLLYAKLMLALNERDRAGKWISKIYASLDRVEIPLLRTSADALARHL